MEIKEFEAGLIRGRDTLMLGGSGKRESFRRLIESWPALCPDCALVVFDHSGALYESFSGRPLLADLASSGSVIPNLIAPFIFSDTLGARSEEIAYTIRQAVYQEIRSRDANDKFFDDLGKLATDRMLVYMLETFKNVLRNLAACAGCSGPEEAAEFIRGLNLFRIFCRQHRYIETLMTRAIGGEEGGLPNRYRLDERPAESLVTRDYALARYILSHELRFQKNEGRENPVPFADLLFTNADNANTQRCIKMQADASTSDFRALISLMTANDALYGELPALDLGEFVRAPEGRPLFVCSSGSAQADRGFAALLVSALGAAAQNEGRPAAVFIPELDRWGLLNRLDAMRQSWERLDFVFGYDNFSRLALDSRSEEGQLIETLYSSSNQRIWHATEEERLCKAFGSYVSEADVIYRPEDLDCELRAVEREGRVCYAALAESVPPAPLRGRTRLRRSSGASHLWLTEGIAAPERLTLESLLEDGETL